MNAPPEQVVREFLEIYREDRAKGAMRSLKQYQARWPGFELAVLGAHEAEQRINGLHVEPDTEDFGPYRLLKELGRGGQGAVWLADDTRLGRRVALKTLSRVGPGSEGLLRRFRREATIAAQLRHPGICVVHDTGITNGVPWIAMELIEGQTLSATISISAAAAMDTYVDLSSVIESPDEADREAASRDENPTESAVLGSQTRLREIARVVEDAARALHAAHEAGVLHRDVKPGNLMVTPESRVVVLDFGLAQNEAVDEMTLTQSGDLMGTPAYMSPEQIAGARRIVLDRRTDVYSLGVVLFECLALKRPFDAPTREALYQEILSKNPPDLRKLNSAVPDDLRVICETAIEKDRDRRYQTALDLAEDLRRFREVQPIHAKPITRWVRFRRWVQRNPGVAASLLAAFVILVAGTTVSTVQAVRADAAADRATKNAERAERNAGQAQENLALAEANEKKAETAANEAKAKAIEARENAEEARNNLRQWRRMADVRLLKDLQREAKGDLWPAWPERLAAMEQWLIRAESLKSRMPDHERVLDALRKKSPAQTETEKRQDREQHPRYVELMDLREKQAALPREIAVLERELAELEKKVDENPRLDVLAERVELQIDDKREEMKGLSERIAALESVIGERRTWTFEVDEDRYQHEVYADLVESARELMADGGLLADVRERRAFAKTLRRKSIEEQAGAWEAAVANVATDSRFAGFQLVPQVGLVPLGPDPASKLEEFWVYEDENDRKLTGEQPKRGSDGKLIITDTTGVVLVLIPGGAFSMGSQSSDPEKPNHDPTSGSDEQPPHAVMLSPYFLSKYELTQHQWSSLAGSNPSWARPPEVQGLKITLRHPVENVSWDDCQEILPRAGLMLPTEAQWERACRAGSDTVYWCGKDVASLQARKPGNIADLTASTRAPWKCTTELEDGHILHAPVGSFAPNAYGLHDVLGNVWEWCEDGLEERGYAYPTREGDGLRLVWRLRERVFRGGSFSGFAEVARSANRSGSTPGNRNNALGVRPARPHTP